MGGKNERRRSAESIEKTVRPSGGGAEMPDVLHRVKGAEMVEISPVGERGEKDVKMCYRRKKWPAEMNESSRYDADEGRHWSIGGVNGI